MQLIGFQSDYMKFTILTAIFSLLLFSNCKTKTENQTTSTAKEVINQSPAEKLLAQTLEAHGGDKYDVASYEFVFRDNKYTFKNSGKGYEYTVNKVVEDQDVFDRIENDNFTRKVNGSVLDLSEEDRIKFAASLNSVIYFATLPYKLQDPAVNLALGEDVAIKNQDYKVLEVTFQAEGGGTDHDDEFSYWINKDTKRIDYLAYNYKVNKGGVRFRSAFNTRVVDGIVFQDYINYKAEVGTPLNKLPALYEKDMLEQLSIIATENVKAL